MTMADENKPRPERQQYHPGDIVWKVRSTDVTPEQKAATLRDQEERRNAFRVGLMKQAVKKRLNKG